MSTGQQEQSCVTLKVDLNGEVRRLRGWPRESSVTSASALRAAVVALFELHPQVAEDIVLKYQDDDQDLCTLTEATLPDALSLAANAGTLRLVAQVATPPSPPAAMPVLQNSPPEDAVQRPGSFVHAVSERFEEARPRLLEGVARFKQQITSDFQEAREDIKGVIKRAPEHDQNLEQPRAVKIFGEVVGSTTGALVAARLLPLRATRLAAHSAAALGQSSSETAAAAEAPEAPEAGGPPESTNDAEATVAAGTTEAGPVQPESIVMEELCHLKEQVKEDFRTARAEVEASFGYFKMFAPREANGVGAGGDANGPTRGAGEPGEGTTGALLACGPTAAIPKVASTVAGITLASTLLPLRAARVGLLGAVSLTHRVTGAMGAPNAVPSSPGDAVSSAAPFLEEPVATEEDVVTLSCIENAASDVIAIPPGFEALRAWYGHPEHVWESICGQDVTAEVRELHRQGLPIRASNELFGDPAHGVVKVLRVEVARNRELAL